ncbi:voltage-dependent calcium channel subunit alpha-2/delta-2 [Elysia marginata]|uniref:Voltage-dependent calcium channel subunit alpha-2/delta-2 n=1 Tax=Elysia marginata TaxID=1093978 RepID=A0AAV4GR88_9GAST|nr:voltage-dependent calcium channel subunit alpha-2/delta-2 [Elysia marginata]
MRRYGPYRDIGFREVNYYNAKKVVIDQDLSQMDNASRAQINQTITYLETKSHWPFKSGGFGLNQIHSSIHVPTNIYDKSRRILNGVNWTTNLTKQFIQNMKDDPTLTWQYFCSSDGFLRVYPAGLTVCYRGSPYLATEFHRGKNSTAPHTPSISA